MDGAVCVQVGHCMGTTRAACCRRVLSLGRSVSTEEAGLSLVQGTLQVFPGYSFKAISARYVSSLGR